jgi:CDP-glucose 4,6-dehydratase
VLEPLHGYITLAERLLTHDPRYATAYNFGPLEDDARPVHWIAERMAVLWGDGASWKLDAAPTLHEAGYLKLDASRARADLGWAPRLRLDAALDYLVAWYRSWNSGADMHAFTLAQIEHYTALLTK